MSFPQIFRQYHPNSIADDWERMRDTTADMSDTLPRERTTPILSLNRPMEVKTAPVISIGLFSYPTNPVIICQQKRDLHQCRDTPVADLSQTILPNAIEEINYHLISYN